MISFYCRGKQDPHDADNKRKSEKDHAGVPFLLVLRRDGNTQPVRVKILNESLAVVPIELIIGMFFDPLIAPLLDLHARVSVEGNLGIQIVMSIFLAEFVVVNDIWYSCDMLGCPRDLVVALLPSDKKAQCPVLGGARGVLIQPVFRNRYDKYSLLHGNAVCVRVVILEGILM